MNKSNLLTKNLNQKMKYKNYRLILVNQNQVKVFRNRNISNYWIILNSNQRSKYILIKNKIEIFKK